MSVYEPLLQPPKANADGAVGASQEEILDSELYHGQSDTRLRAQGHDPQLKRSFSSFAALGLGFR